MANTNNGNTLYIDTAGAVTTAATQVTGVYVTPTAATCSLILKDNSTANELKLQIDLAVQQTVFFDHRDNPMVFPGGVDADTVTDCVATLIVRKSGG